MKFKTRVYEYGEVKTKKKFLLLPRRDTKTGEVRWLQFATCKYTYCCIVGLLHSWNFVGFIDE